MKTRIIKASVALALALSLSACRLELIVSDGGSIESDSGARDCVGPDYCIFEVSDTGFIDRFTVSVNPGYEFLGWQGGGKFLCGDSIVPVCDVNVPLGEVGEAILANYDSAQLMPLFRYVGVDTDNDGIDNRDDSDDDNDQTPDKDDLCPLDPEPTCGIGEVITSADTIVIGNREWAQPVLFSDVSWNQVNAACPNSICLEGAVLNGYDLTGWRWAHVTEVAALFNSYNSEFLVHVEEQYIDGPDDSPWAQAMLAEGWRDCDILDFDSYVVAGWVWGAVYREEDFSEPIDFDHADAYMGSYHGTASMSISGLIEPQLSHPVRGAWLYRAP